MRSLRGSIGGLFAAAALLSCLTVTASAAGAVASGSAGTCNMVLAYGVTSVLALILAVGYWGIVKNKDLWLLLLFFAVVVVNLGYFSLSISKTLEEALLANRLSYLGSVFLPLCMLMAILNVCRVRYPRFVPVVLLCVSIVVFLVAATPGYLDCYYREVSLQFVNGMATLKKVYGPLHGIYLMYLLAYFGAMVAVVIFSVVSGKIGSYQHAALLLTIVLMNIAIWAVEQLIHTEFEFLALSYIASELLLLLLYGMMQDMGLLQPAAASVGREMQDALSAETAAPEEMEEGMKEGDICRLAEAWSQQYALTSREADVLQALLRDTRRKEIAAGLNVTEHTIKKHTGNIFSKMEVSSRAELFERARKDRGAV